eukprot:m.421922 g.421922  ORF g.421922 m.421922 type:complete len:153 (+) comp16850_c0_seq7:482-940(+)
MLHNYLATLYGTEACGLTTASVLWPAVHSALETVFCHSAEFENFATCVDKSFECYSQPNCSVCQQQVVFAVTQSRHSAETRDSFAQTRLSSKGATTTTMHAAYATAACTSIAPQFTTLDESNPLWVAVSDVLQIPLSNFTRVQPLLEKVARR